MEGISHIWRVDMRKRKFIYHTRTVRNEFHLGRWICLFVWLFIYSFIHSLIRSFVHFCSARHGPFSWMDRHRQIIVLSGASNRLIPECISGLGPSRFDRRFMDVDVGDPILSSRFTMFADFVFCEVTVSKGTFFGIPIDTL